VTGLRRFLLLLLVAAVVPGCSVWPKVTGEERRAQEQARQLDEIQQKCQRYADGYAGKVLETVGPIRKRTSDPEVFNRLLSWEITQLNSAYTIATGPSPVACQLDFVVLAALSRMVAEDTLAALDSDLTRPLPAVYRDLEQEAWTSAATVLTPA